MSTIRQFGKRLTRLASFAMNKLATGNNIIGRVISNIIRSTGGTVIIRRPPPMAQRQLLIKTIRAGAQRSAANVWWRGTWFGRLVGPGMRTGAFTNLRAVMLSPVLRGNGANQTAPHHRISLASALAGFAYLATQKDAGFDSVLQRVRELFEKHCRMKTVEEWPRMLDGYDVGSYMGKGCSGAIYEARVRGQSTPAIPESNTNAIAESSLPDDSAIVVYSHTFTDDEYAKWLRRKELYPLAIKMCFNFEFTMNSDRILRSLDRERELVPATSRDIQGLLRWSRPIPFAHPNIVELKTAFVDYIRELPLAKEKWPAALGEGQTLYMVMKRYSMTLRQYILLHQYTFRTAQLLLGQLLEALAYLASCQIAHRDMKSNNILVDFDHPDEPPRLVLADFGSCLSIGDMRLPYPRDGVDLGGNALLRAPEIIFATPGPKSYVDFTKADAWAAGTLAYEIFTRVNPFYLRPDGYLSNITYTESDLKPLPKEVTRSVSHVVRHLLKRDPSERPSAAVAANVVALSLFRMEFLTDFLSQANILRSGIDFLHMKFALSDVVSLYAAETILGRTMVNGDSDGAGMQWRLSKTEQQLRMTFLRRLDADSLIDSLQYFVDS